jgi:short-subunit dehydrogenase
MDLNNINCVVTGASSGIGKELSLLLAGRGCTVVAVARSKERLNQLAMETASMKGTVLPIVFDLEDAENYSELRDLISEKIGKIDLLVNNAALGHFSSFSDQESGDIIKVARTTFLAPILTTSACLPIMRNGKGAVVFVSSLAGKIGFPNLAVYSAAKHGLEGFADSLNQEVRSSVFIFRPGVTETRFFERSGMTEFEKYAKESGLMKTAKQVAIELVDALEKDKKVYTVGADRYLIAILPFITRSMRFSVLNFFNKIDKMFN